MTRSANQIAISEAMKRHWQRRRAREQAMTFSVLLPMPPTANNLYVNAGKRGRVPSREYEAWMKQAILETFAQVPAVKRIGGSVEILIQIAPKTPGDIDNRIKAVLDCLVKARRIDDDKNVWRVTIERYPLVDPHKALVSVAATAMQGSSSLPWRDTIPRARAA